jgi:hypothetical protein
VTIKLNDFNMTQSLSAFNKNSKNLYKVFQEEAPDIPHLDGLGEDLSENWINE